MAVDRASRELRKFLHLPTCPESISDRPHFEYTHIARNTIITVIFSIFFKSFFQSVIIDFVIVLIIVTTLFLLNTINLFCPSWMHYAFLLK